MLRYWNMPERSLSITINSARDIRVNTGVCSSRERAAAPLKRVISTVPHMHANSLCALRARARNDARALGQ